MKRIISYFFIYIRIPFLLPTKNKTKEFENLTQLS